MYFSVEIFVPLKASVIFKQDTICFLWFKIIFILFYDAIADTYQDFYTQNHTLLEKKKSEQKYFPRTKKTTFDRDPPLVQNEQI